ncbi:Aldo_ket_red domain-containing protein [Mucor velutinosus]|uniref:Aldo_ket_red domain-containing protein n=1 Tax=Mucor velutinosus TaxID=708070 RepID=A0AAN7DBG8_9FUNG|nr:Aldo_ket_red domain-containing protein [Mucor velutinosus]
MDNDFISQAIECCKGIYLLYTLLPRCIIVGTEEIDQIVVNTSMNQNISFARGIRCDFWAIKCLLVSKDAMLNHDDARHPLIEILNGIAKYNWVSLSKEDLIKSSYE